MIGHQAVGPYRNAGLPRLLGQQIKIDFVIAVFKEDRLAPIAALSHMMWQPRDHHARQPSHTEDDSTVRWGIGIVSPYFPDFPDFPDFPGSRSLHWRWSSAAR